MPADEPSGRAFGYGISRASWVMLAVLALAVALIAGESLLVATPGTWSEERVMGLALIALILGGVLLPVPVLDILWWLRGRVVIAADGLHWRAWGAWQSREWARIIAIGRPTSAARRTDDTRLHVITEDGYEFIYGYQLREADAAVEAMLSWADLPEREQVGRYLFHCRPATSEQVAARAAEHIHTGGYDPWDFWASRARRF